MIFPGNTNTLPGVFGPTGSRFLISLKEDVYDIREFPLIEDSSYLAYKGTAKHIAKQLWMDYGHKKFIPIFKLRHNPVILEIQKNCHIFNSDKFTINILPQCLADIRQHLEVSKVLLPFL
jgi:hypothetical protein